MIFCSSKYLISKHHKVLAALAVLLTVTGAAGAQIKNPVAANNPLYFYNSIKVEQPARSYTKLNYKRPNNQLMSWPNYPLTAAQAEQRMNQNARDNKFSHKVAKDIITAVFSKKKPVAVIPKF